MEITRDDIINVSWLNKGDPTKFIAPQCPYKQQSLFTDACYRKYPFDYYSVQLLLEIGCKPHYKYERIIKIAIRQDDITLFRNIMDKTKCQIPSYECQCGDEIIKLAIKYGNSEMVSTILAAEEDPNLNNYKKTKDTMLFRAMEVGNAEIVKTLLKYGADVNYNTKTGVNVFLQYCIHHHKDDNYKCFEALYNHPKRYDWSDSNDLVFRAVRLRKWKILEIIANNKKSLYDVDLSYKHDGEYGCMLDYSNSMLKESSAHKNKNYNRKIQKIIDILKPIKEQRRKYLCEETKLCEPLINIINNYT